IRMSRCAAKKLIIVRGGVFVEAHQREDAGDVDAAAIKPGDEVRLAQERLIEPAIVEVGVEVDDPHASSRRKTRMALSWRMARRSASESSSRSIRRSAAMSESRGW